MRTDLHESGGRAAVQLCDGDAARGRQELQGQVLGSVWEERGQMYQEASVPETRGCGGKTCREYGWMMWHATEVEGREPGACCSQGMVVPGSVKSERCND